MPVSISMCLQGRRREINQDRAGQFSVGDYGLYMVADGMGGHFEGDRASQTVLSALSAWWEQFLTAPQRPGFYQGAEQLRQLIKECNHIIRIITPTGRLCGTTAVVLWVREEEYALLSVGDSRCYQAVRRWPAPIRIRQLTHDDVAGPDGPGGKRNAGKLLHALGAEEDCPLVMQMGRAAKGTVFLLCTDGVYKPCREKIFAEALKKAVAGESLQVAGETIMESVAQAGAADDHSLVLVRI